MATPLYKHPGGHVVYTLEDVDYLREFCRTAGCEPYGLDIEQDFELIEGCGNCPLIAQCLFVPVEVPCPIDVDVS